jgi:D-apionate oxidoisomerase
MPTKIALFGAGGKMGYRLASNLKPASFEVRHVERSPAAQEHLKTGLGLACVSADEAL